MHYVKQDGQAVFKFAVRKSGEICRRLLDRHGVDPSQLDLFVSHQANRRIIEAAAEGRFVLAVTNGGVPIPPEAREMLFQPFFRGMVRPSQQGLGLGLFIVNEIARAHDGSVEVESTEEFTRFTFSMPLVREPQG